MNKGNIIRWIAVSLMLCCIALTVSSPAIAEEKTYQLGIDQLIPGNPTIPSGWTDAENYSDPTITVTTEHMVVKKLPCSIVRIKIADPSQIRTAMSHDDYSKTGYVKALALSKHVNAVAAVNGDFFKYYDFGYLVRQGVLYRDAPNGKRDVLFIDDQGDFYAVRNAKSEDIQDFLTSTFPKDRTVINTFTLGPVLVENGEVQEITTREFQHCYKMQRVAIVQLGHLEYAIVECDGKADASYGMTMTDFAAFIKELFPDCLLAYNLDGGGSTNVIVGEKRIHKNPNTRQISDILYFASAYTEE
ncbi:MAG: phosphodiester glycosidase family protein [Clostridia bacterium]|nr:phosphodiester glycosidase family protein [Clostridia bacterium]